jgi:hypothetical protein
MRHPFGSFELLVGLLLLLGSGSVELEELGQLVLPLVEPVEGLGWELLVLGL